MFLIKECWPVVRRWVQPNMHFSSAPMSYRKWVSSNWRHRLRRKHERRTQCNKERKEERIFQQWYRTRRQRGQWRGGRRDRWWQRRQRRAFPRRRERLNRTTWASSSCQLLIFVWLGLVLDQESMLLAFSFSAGEAFEIASRSSGWGSRSSRRRPWRWRRDLKKKNLINVKLIKGLIFFFFFFFLYHGEKWWWKGAF